MAVLPLVIAPDPRLKAVCDPVGTVDAQVRQLMDDLLETMRVEDGIGLAAPQVGVTRRVIAVAAPRNAEDDDGEGRSRKPLLMADPEIAWVSDETETCEEGCLSLPQQYGEVTRSARVRVRYLDRDGKPCEVEAEGLFGRCIQHEMDHLNGVLFVDHLSALRRRMILKKLAKEKRLNGVA